MNKLQALYRAIPTFTCKPGCNDCCGPVPFAKAEWQAVKVKRAGPPGCTDCAYASDAGCAIYADRPFMCRLFGATDDPKMACPHGCKPATPLTKKQSDILTAKYVKLMGEAPAGWSVDVSHAEALVRR